MAKQVVARVDEKLHRAIKAKAAREGKTMNEVMRELLKRWIEEKDDERTEED